MRAMDMLGRSVDPDRRTGSRRLPLFLAAFGLGVVIGIVGLFRSNFTALGSGPAIVRFMLWPTGLAIAISAIGGVLAVAAKKPGAATVSRLSFVFLIGLWTPIGVLLFLLFVLIAWSNSRRQ